VNIKFYEDKKAKNIDYHGLNMKFDVYYEQKFKFVNERPKLYNLETLKLNILINSKRFTLTSDLIINKRKNDISTSNLVTDRTRSGILTPLSSLYNNIFNNIDLLLFIFTLITDVLFQAPIHDIINVNNFLNINKRENYLVKIV
jgi:hypothetical protein